ncbi:MAG: endonuclease/exonuclease/phosphatase family protein [Gaiellaceae bacterium]
MALLVRTWNLFHGNAVPVERRAYVAEMLGLAIADEPDVLCAQEVPVWALERLDEWSGMRVFASVARRPSIGPLPSTARLGRRLTDLNAGRLRSAFAGQANAILLAPEHRGSEAGSIVLNARAFRRAQGRWLELDPIARLAWAKERRTCHAVRLSFSDGRRALVANLHATGSPDKRIPDAEVVRAATFADALAAPDELCVLAGDFNVRPDVSRTLLDLTGPDWGFSDPGPGIDHVLVRGAPSTPAMPWRLQRRRVGQRLLSDHAPVEVTIE